MNILNACPFKVQVQCYWGRKASDSFPISRWWKKRIFGHRDAYWGGDCAHVGNKKADGRDETIGFQPWLPINHGASTSQWWTDPIPWRFWSHGSERRPRHQFSLSPSSLGDFTEQRGWVLVLTSVSPMIGRIPTMMAACSHPTDFVSSWHKLFRSKPCPLLVYSVWLGSLTFSSVYSKP